MRAFILLGCFAMGLVLTGNTSADAQHPAFAQGGLGFFNPYTFPPSSSVRTPPYFSVHPPVYYSSRHARPYGMSPFAAPPLVSAAPNYQGRQASQFEAHPIATPHCSACAGSANAAPGHLVHQDVPFEFGEVQINPFAESEQLARKP